LCWCVSFAWSRTEDIIPNNQNTFFRYLLERWPCRSWLKHIENIVRNVVIEACQLVIILKRFHVKFWCFAMIRSARSSGQLMHSRLLVEYYKFEFSFHKSTFFVNWISDHRAWNWFLLISYFPAIFLLRKGQITGYTCFLFSVLFTKRHWILFWFKREGTNANVLCWKVKL
jgi:hypothetical protein